MRRIDLSMPLRPGMPTFPGDVPFRVERSTSLEKGDPYNLSQLFLGSHSGTHLDPPLHFLPGGSPVDLLDLAVLNGPCRVVEVRPGASRIGLEDLPAFPSGTHRILFRTTNSARWARGEGFFPDYVALTLPAARELIERGIRLVGIDALSIESDPTEKYPVHHALLGAGIPILEGLLLQDAPPGVHELECLPLRIVDGDGGPARAILRVD
ncbi:MAG: cyclase family protein [Thermoplasmata archaeon]|jgi:arylformamidase|nr:cyclase family protein [Thermoplasmata archaeon]